MEEEWMIINTYVLHCQSLALNRPRLFSASVFPISVPPAFIILASVVFSENRKIMQYESGEIPKLSVYTVLIKASYAYPGHIYYSWFFWQSLHFHI